MIEVLLAALAQIAGPAVNASQEPPVRRDEISSISMPREIVPAHVPYSKCTGEVMNAVAGASSGPTSGQAIREAQQRSIVTCSASRVQAKAEAIKLLSNTAMAAGDREALVEQVLTAMDHAYDNLADLMDGAPKNFIPKD